MGEGSSDKRFARRALALAAGVGLLLNAICVFKFMPGWLTRIPYLSHILLTFCFVFVPCLWYYGATGKSGFKEYGELEKRIERRKNKELLSLNE